MSVIGPDKDILCSFQEQCGTGVLCADIRKIGRARYFHSASYCGANAFLGISVFVSHYDQTTLRISEP
jgi:hypothetical protein